MTFSCGQARRGVWRSCESPEAAQRGLDALPLAVAAPVVADLLLAAARAWDNRRDARNPPIGAQLIGVVDLVGGQGADAPRCDGEHHLSGRQVPGVAGRQQERAGAVEHVCEGVYLGRLGVARRADVLRMSPTLPLWAKRRART